MKKSWGSRFFSSNTFLSWGESAELIWQELPRSV